MTKRQGDLKGMPPKTELEKSGEKLLDKWENLQGKKAELSAAKKELLISMKKANKSVIHLVDSDGIKRKIEYKESEGITIKKDSPKKGEE